MEAVEVVPLRLLTVTASTDGVNVSGSESAPTTAARTDELQAYIEDQLPNGTPVVIGRGLHLLDVDEIELGNRAELCGLGPDATIFRAKASAEGRLIATEDIASWISSGEGLWTYEGVPMAVYVHDFGIHGGGTINDNPWTFSLELEETLTGMELYSPAARAENLHFYMVDGTAFKYRRGVNTLAGTYEYADTEVARFRGLSGMKALTGFHIVNSADGYMSDCSFSIARDACFRFECGAWNISRIHAAGCLTSDGGDDEKGIAIIVGAHDGSSGENYLGELIQADNARIGLRSNSTNNLILQFVGKFCWHQTLHIRKRTLLGQAFITKIGGVPATDEFNDSPTGITIEQDATESDIGGAGLVMEFSTGVTGGTFIECLANNSRIKLGAAYGLGAAGNTGLHLGSASVAPYGVIADLTLSGIGTGLYIDGIGKGCDIVIRSVGGVTNPVVVRDTVDPSGNRIRVIDTASGNETVLYDFS